MVVDVDEAVEKLATVFPDLDRKATYTKLSAKASRFAWLRRQLTPRQQSDILALGIPGVGFRLSYQRPNNGRVDVMPVALPWAGSSSVYYNINAGAVYRMELIKTGNNMPSRSVVNLGTVATFYGDLPAPALGHISVNSIELKVLPKCHVDSSTLNIDFGPFGPADVSTTAGPTRQVDFTVRCSGPTPPATITATLAGTPDGDDPRFIRNTGATNLAIRLADRSTSYVLKPNDSNSALIHEPYGAMASSFSLDATVLRVGKHNLGPISDLPGAASRAIGQAGN